jgi:DNA repair exonuclease SbcCD ATPase subunit
MTRIEIQDIGPVEEFRFDLPEPGLYVLRGRQGAGKTTILRTVQLAADGRADVTPTKRDGAKKGEATIAGKTIRIAKQIREEGDLTVEGLGDLDIAALHSPKYLEPATRDKHRIKVLVRLAGLTADASLFHGGLTQFESVVQADALKTDDLVEMAARVKRAIERAALDAESRRESALAAMRAQAALAEAVDTGAPHDEQALAAQLAAAIETRARIVQQRTDGMAIIERAAAARKGLEAMTPPDVASAQANVDLTTKELQAAADRVDDLEAQLIAARAVLENARARHAAAIDHQQAIKSHADMYARWKADIDAAAAITCPDADDVAAAEYAVTVAQKAVQHGVKVREAIIATAKAHEHSAAAGIHEKQARRLRDAAQATQDVLSDAIGRIPGCPLRALIDGDGDARLVVQTDRSEAEPFDELSDGERWIITMQLAAGRGRLIVLPQAAYGELSDSSRKLLHDLAVEHGCYLLTAHADDGELRGEPYMLVNELAVA